MYCQLSDVKQSLGITGATYDAQLTEYISVASTWIDAYCNMESVTSPFEVTSDSTRYFDYGNVDGQCLNFDTPILSITSIINGDGQTIPSTGYRLMPRNQPRYYQVKLDIDYVWDFLNRDSEIAITGRWGYSLTVPQPVVEACRHMAGWMHQRWQAGLNTSSATSEIGTIGQVTDIPAHVKTLLEIYVDRRVML